MSKQFDLSDLLSNLAIQDFASALRKALRENEDYSSLVELEYTETKEQFLETIKKFLRRYETYAKKFGRIRAEEKSLVEIGKLVDQYGPKLVRSALISLALCKRSEQE